MYRRILVPTDGSVCSDRAVDHAVAIARAMGATVAFLFVMDTLRTYQEGVVTVAQALETLGAQGKASLDRAQQAATKAGVPAGAELVEGGPVEVIVQRAPDFDLVVMGSHGKGLWKRLALGSVTQAVLHRITRPLLVVRAGVEEGEASGAEPAR
jgi:nucleotide-binding universal stress UspA family protein